ncbi:MAG: hypothetical protein ACRDA4_09855 [Filifactoraceae bacterium]
MNICVDIDGTLTSPKHFVSYFNKYFNKDVSDKELEEYNLNKIYKISDEELNEFYKIEGIRMQKEAKLLDFAKEVLNEWKNRYKISIITARKPESIGVIKDWLRDNEIEWIPTYATGNPDKLKIAKHLNCDVFIEDHPEFSLVAADSGIKVILMDAAYNQSIQHKNIFRAYNWKEVDWYIEKFSSEI